MKSKKIYLIRHGQTEFNLKGIVQGSGVDTSLNEKGKAQAQAFYNTYQHVPFDKIYTSTLKRTAESVEPFIRKGVPHEALAGLNEISWGLNEGQKITPEEDAYYHWMLEQWQKGDTSQRIRGGESPEDVAIRQRIAIDHIFDKSREHEETILVCMHGRAIRIILCLLLNYPLKSMDMFEHTNLCLYELDFTGSMFTIRKHNDIAHLSGLTEVSEKKTVPSTITP